MLSTAIGRLRLVSLADGISYLLLLGIAVPLKHLGNWPLGVKVLGPIHGFLFMLLFLAIFHAWMKKGWGLGRPALIVLCAIIPLAPFWLDKRLKSEEANS